MKVLKGISASPGLAKGTACLYSEEDASATPRYVISKGRAAGETLRFNKACDKAKATMREMIKASEKLFGKSAGEIFSAHLAVLEDPVLYENIERFIKERLINAEHAVSDAFEEYIKNYQLSNLHFAELSHDIIDVRNRLLASFGSAKGRFKCPIGKKEAVIVVSKRLVPSMVLNIPKDNVLAFVAEEGGFTTHATILARSYGVPMLFGVDIDDNIGCSDKVIVDGLHGVVYVSPDKETEERFSRKISEASRRRAACALIKGEGPKTRKGLRVKLKANISTPGEVELLKGVNFDGIGLLRTEFLFVNKEAPPGEDDQRDMYRDIIESAGGREVTVRLLDIGIDKMPGYLHLPRQDNPDLGIRGARALDFFYEVYFTQIKAILRAARREDVRILYPMVSDAGDLRSFKILFSRAKAALKKEKKAYGRNVKQGIMIETPSAALMARSLIEDVDFANIGSNDLLQYTLAASRGNVSVEKRYHILHPSLVRLIEIVAKAGRSLKKEVCLCGEVAGFDKFYPVFLGLGLRSFSVAASRVEDIKCALFHQSKASPDIKRKFYDAKTKEDIDRLFEN